MKVQRTLGSDGYSHFVRGTGACKWEDHVLSLLWAGNIDIHKEIEWNYIKVMMFPQRAIAYLTGTLLPVKGNFSWLVGRRSPWDSQNNIAFWFLFVWAASQKPKLRSYCWRQ